jgi:HK97 gp10 family phage protein
MARKSIDVQGLNNILKKLDKLGAEGQKMKKDVLKSAAEHTANKIKEAAPNDGYDEKNHSAENEKYGKLVDNIKYEWNETYQNYEIHTNDAYWSIMYEKGSINQDPKPFFEPTFRRQKNKNIKLISDEVKKRLNL